MPASPGEKGNGPKPGLDKKEEGVGNGSYEGIKGIEDLIELMGSQKRKRKECVENECAQKRPRECEEML